MTLLYLALFSSFFLFAKPFNKIPPDQLYPDGLFNSQEEKACVNSLFHNSNDKGCNTEDAKVLEAVTDYLCRYNAGDALFNFGRNQKPKTTITNCYCCGFIFRYLELGEVCTAYCNHSGQGVKIKGREPLIDLPFNWGDECPLEKLDGDRNKLPLEPCGQVSPKFRHSTLKPPSATTLRSITTTEQIKSSTTTTQKPATTKKVKATTFKPPNSLEPHIEPTTRKNTRRKAIFENQRKVFRSGQKVTSNQSSEDLFTSAVLITQPSVVTKKSTTLSTTTTHEQLLIFSSKKKIKVGNIKEATTLRPIGQIKRHSIENDNDPPPVWDK